MKLIHDRWSYVLAWTIIVGAILFPPSPAMADPPIFPGDIIWMDRGIGQSGGTRLVRIDPVTGKQSVYASDGLLADGISHDLEFDLKGDLLITQRLDDGIPTGRVIKIDRMTGEQSIISSGGLLSQNPSGGTFLGMAVEPEGTILVSNFALGIVRIDADTGSQTLFSTTDRIAPLLVDNGTIWAIRHLGFDMLQIDRTTAAESILSIDFSLTPPNISSLRDSHKIALAANGDLLVAGIDDFTDSTIVIRINKVTGVASPVIALLEGEYFPDVAVEANGNILVAGALPDQTPVVIRINPWTDTFATVTAGDLLALGLRGIAVAPKFNKKVMICHKNNAGKCKGPFFSDFTLKKAEIMFDKKGGMNDRFKVEGEFTLGPDNNGINLATDNVVVGVGMSSVSISAGSFVAVGSKYKFDGVVSGVKVNMAIKEIGSEKFSFKAEAKKIDLTGTPNPLDIFLAIGGDAGMANPRLKGKLKFSKDHEKWLRLFKYLKKKWPNN